MYGEAVVTLLTVQNTRTVSRVEVLDPRLVVEQLRAVLEDIPPHAAKLGALGNAAVIEAVAAEARGFRFPLVIDPVMISKHGAPLMDESARSLARRLLLPCAALVTPNLHEAAELTGRAVTNVAEMRDAARALCDLGAKAALVKGGHLEGAAADVLLAGGVFHEYPGERIETPHTHGTGCTYSAAIAAELAHGRALPEAVAAGKKFISEAIRTAPGLGSGNGPVNHHARV